MKSHVRLLLTVVLLVAALPPTSYAQEATPQPKAPQQANPQQGGVLPYGTVDMRRPTIIKVDSLGRVVQHEAEGILQANYTYQGNTLASVTQGTGTEARTTRYAYNSDGVIKRITDPLGHETRFTYNADRLVTTQHRADGDTISYIYRDGRIIGVVPPGQPAHMLTYGTDGLVTAYTAPYVPGGGSTTTTYTYSDSTHLKQIGFPDGITLTLSYDDSGRLSKLSSPRGDIVYTYKRGADVLDNVVSPEGDLLTYKYQGESLAGIMWSGAVTGSVQFVYNRNGTLPVEQRVNDTGTVTLQYDSSGRVIRAGDLTVQRNQRYGQLVDGTQLGNLADTWEYNEFGEPTKYRVQFGQDEVFSIEYKRDKLGRVTEKDETFDGLATTWEYSYDVVGRLVGVKRNNLTVSTYRYDPNGNRLQGPRSQDSGEYDEQDRIISYRGNPYKYTNSGYLQSKMSGQSKTTYGYDALGNLLSVTLPSGQKIAYLVDGTGRRIGKQIGGDLVQAFLYKDDLYPIAELDGQNQVVNRFIYASRLNIPDYMVKNDTVYRIIADHLGSPRLVINVATGLIAQRLVYDEFGNVVLDTNPGFQPFGFAGGLYDPDTRLVRFGVRDYDPEAGRWTAKDPLRFEGGDTNLYAYLSNDPVNYIDPTGYSFWSELVHAALGGAAEGIQSAAVQCALRDKSVLKCALRGIAAAALSGMASYMINKVAEIPVASQVTNTPTKPPTVLPRPSPTPQPVATSRPVSTAASAISSLSIIDIQNQHLTLKGTQWDIYVRSILGQRVHWRGTISALHNDRSITVAIPGAESWVSVWVDEIPDDIFVNFREGQQVEFEARVFSISKFLWLYVHLDEATILR